MEGTIKCKRCRLYFTDEEEYNKHVEDHVLCKRCYMGFSEKDYQNHMKDHAYRESKCPHCAKRFKPSSPQEVGTMYVEHLHSCKKAPQLFTQNKTSDSTVSQAVTALQSVPELDFGDEKVNKKSEKKTERDSMKLNIKPCLVILTDVSHTSVGICEATDTTTDGTLIKSNAATNEHTVSNIHRCNCGGVFSSKDDYELHVEKKHTSLYCSKCGITFKSVVAHALHSCSKTSVTVGVIRNQGSNGLSSEDAESVSSVGRCDASKLPADETSQSSDDSVVFIEHDIKPVIHSNDSCSPLLKKLVKLKDVQLPSNKIETIFPCNKPVLSKTVISQYAKVPQKVSLSSNTKTGSVEQKILQNFCDETSSLQAIKQGQYSVDSNPKHHFAQTSFCGHQPPYQIQYGHGKAPLHPQMQHYQQNTYPQWHRMGMTKVENVAQHICQCDVCKVNFSNSLVTNKLSKPGTEVLPYFTNASSPHIHQNPYIYPTNSWLPCLIPALDKNSGLKYHDTDMSLNLISGEQMENSLKPHKFPKVLDKSNTQRICQINDIRTIKDFSERPAKKIVNVVFPETRSNCHASAVVSAAGEEQLIDHYNCEMCLSLFYTAESVIMHLQDEHQVYVGNELRVFAL